MIDNVKTIARGVLIHTFNLNKVDIVDVKVIAITVNKIYDCATYTANSWDRKLHRTGMVFNRFSPAFNEFCVGFPGIFDPKPHPARGRPVFTAKIACG